MWCTRPPPKGHDGTDLQVTLFTQHTTNWQNGEHIRRKNWMSKALKVSECGPPAAPSYHPWRRYTSHTYYNSHTHARMPAHVRALVVDTCVVHTHHREHARTCSSSTGAPPCRWTLHSRSLPNRRSSCSCALAIQLIYQLISAAKSQPHAMGRRWKDGQGLLSKYKSVAVHCLLLGGTALACDWWSFVEQAVARA